MYTEKTIYNINCRKGKADHLRIMWIRGKQSMKELLEILEEIRPDVDFETATTLIDDEILDSFDIISIVGELNDHYDIEINVNDLLPENFNSAGAILELVEKLQNE